MVDSPERTVTPVNEVLSPSPLVMRLDRRRTEPLGAIDLRRIPSVTIYLPPWFAKRFALLDRLQKRFGNCEHEATNTELLFATPSPGAQIHAFTTVANTSVISQFKEESTSSPATGNLDSLPSQQFRVRRQPALFSNDASPSQPAGAEPDSFTIPAMQSGSADAIAPSPLAPDRTSKAANSITTSAISGQSSQPLLWAENASQRTERSLMPHPFSLVDPEPDPSPPNIAAEKSSNFTAIAPPPLSPNRSPITKSIVAVASTSVRPAQPLTLPQSASHPLVPAQSQPEGVPATPSLDLAAPVASSLTASTMIPHPSELPILSRRSSHPIASFSQASQPLANQLDFKAALPAIAPEILANLTPLQRSSMVWRKSNPQTGLALANSSDERDNDPAIAPQIKPAAYPKLQGLGGETGSYSSMPTSPATTWGKTSVPETEIEIDVVQIAERVSRILARNLAVKRERGGANR